MSIRFNTINKKVKIIFVIVCVTVVLGGLFIVGKGKGESKSQSPVVTTTVSEPSAKAEINQTFLVSISNASKVTREVNFTITSVERKGEIRLKDVTRRPASGKDYLLIRIEIQNDHSEKLAIASQDRIRMVGDQGKLFAPDYHNGAIVVEPLSVKKDLVAYVVDKSTKSFSFMVGDLNGEKQRIEVNF